MQVPFLKLKLQYETIKDEIHDAINEVIAKTAFAGGPFVAQFEKEFVEFRKCQYAIGVGSGTEALLISLFALGIGHGDEVITVPNNFYRNHRSHQLLWSHTGICRYKRKDI